MPGRERILCFCRFAAYTDFHYLNAPFRWTEGYAVHPVFPETIESFPHTSLVYELYPLLCCALSR